MKERLQAIRWREFFTKLTDTESDDPTTKRKGQLLALYIGLCFFLLIYTLLNTAIVLALNPSLEYTIYLIEDFVAIIPFLIFWRMNQRGKVLLTAYISISFTILVAVFGSDTRFLEYSMVVFALPIGISSFIIRPSSSFFFATLTTVSYIISSFVYNYIWEYNLTAVIALFALALLTWVTSRQLENAMHKNDDLVANLQKRNKQIRAAYESTLEGWSHALEIRDRETEGHTERVTELTMSIGRQMGFSEEELLHIRRGALLHDIGKLGIPDDILHKPGPLTDEERAVMQTHPQIAVKLLTPIDYLKPALNIPRYHHEKWDGTGYPNKLKGEEIPLEARIFAIIDVYDALSFDRPYRKAWEKQKVLDFIISESGKHFDPRVVEIFIHEIKKDEHQDPTRQ